eukprot:CAMPEP_0202865256 /NCGR_PEP_ID=MMETSP1391-20130828/5460_1 /ASSEMBLY_ACC=CAM_ASM_000867 /TAXON_ID=1034604 /ORGANISM="Chlamydomonas leiostraca, Strain SAG 11-49" /LENGTH=229 /DNA_ID=CAMNT_0049545069 /DNA_START=134 /DNA_END=823 /DNA_ORIENTATION=+
MSFELYRQTHMGDCLVEALEELMQAGKVTEELANTIIKQFDASMLDALRNKVQGKATIKANLKTYRYFDNVWQFTLENVNLRLTNMGTAAVPPEVTCARAKVVCVDAKLLEEGDAAAAAAAGGAPGGEGAGPVAAEGAAAIRAHAAPSAAAALARTAISIALHFQLWPALCSSQPLVLVVQLLMAVIGVADRSKLSGFGMWLSGEQAVKLKQGITWAAAAALRERVGQV